MKEAKLRMEDALNATRAAVEEGIIAGGGSAYIHASKEVAKLADTLEGDERTGAKVILKALEAPLYHISANAGLEGAVIINKVNGTSQSLIKDTIIIVRKRQQCSKEGTWHEEILEVIPERYFF